MANRKSGQNEIPCCAGEAGGTHSEERVYAGTETGLQQWGRGPPGEAAGHTAGTGKIISFLRATNAKKTNQTKKPTKVNGPRHFFFFLAIFIRHQSWIFLKMDSRWHLEQSCAKLRKTNWKEFHNLKISESWSTGSS